MGGERPVRLGDGILKHNSFPRNGIKEWRDGLWIPVASEMIRAQRVNGDEHNIGTGRRPGAACEVRGTGRRREKRQHQKTRFHQESIVHQ